MLLYGDGYLAIREQAKGMILKLGKYFPTKPGSIGPPAAL